MKSFLLSDVDSPQVIFEVGGKQIESTVIKSAKKSPNFEKPLLFIDVVSLTSVFVSERIDVSLMMSEDVAQRRRLHASG